MGDHMKKICKAVALTLAMLLVLPLTACVAIHEAIAPSPSPTPTATPSPTPTATPTPTPTPTSEPTPKPDVNLFEPAVGNYNGYQSSFFGFSFSVPHSYWIPSRTEINELNNIQKDLTYGAEFNQAYIDRLKADKPVYDYLFSGPGDAYICVIADDYSNYTDQPYTELRILDNYLDWLTDSNGFQLNITSLDFNTVKLLGQDHPYYRFGYKDETGQHNGRLMALEHGTTFAILLLLECTEEDMNEVIGSIQPYR